MRLLLPCALSLFLLQADVYAQRPQLLRIAIVDDSFSMSGEKSNVVRKELEEFTLHLPPSPANPIALILFGSAAAPAQVYTDANSWKTAVNKIVGGSGGTSIASGLREAHRFVQSRESAVAMLLLLFTDGEDSDQNAIQEEEAKLSQIFANRSQQGLSSSVYMKRWGNANSELAARLAADPNVKLLDSKDMQLKTVTLEPGLRVARVDRQPDPHYVKVAIEPSVGVTPANSAVAPQVDVECTTPGTRGDTKVTLDPRNLPASLNLDLTISDAQLAAAEFPLDFSFKTAADHRDALGSLVLCQLTKRQILVPVKLPTLDLRNRVTAILNFHKPPRWSDPLQHRAVYPIKITFEVVADDKATNIDRSASFSIAAGGATKIVSGEQRFTLSGEGTFDVELELETSPLDNSLPLKEMKFAFELTIKPIRLAPNVRFVPPQLDIGRDDLPAPDPLLTNAKIDVSSLESPRWVRLPDLAMVEGILRLQVQGIVPPQSQISISAPATVSRLQFAPQSIHSGEQLLRFRMFLSLPPAPQVAEIMLSPVATHATKLPIEFGPITDVRLRLPGPTPLTIVSTDNRGQLQAMIRRFVPDTATQVTVPICPVLAGPVIPAAMETLQARVSTSDQTATAQQFPLYQPTALTIPVAVPEDRSFFNDHQQVIPLVLMPSEKTPIVNAGSCQLVVVHRAPFKRLLFYVVVAVGSLLVVFFLVRTFGKLTTKEE